MIVFLLIAVCRTFTFKVIIDMSGVLVIYYSVKNYLKP